MKFLGALPASCYQGPYRHFKSSQVKSRALPPSSDYQEPQPPVHNSKLKTGASHTPAESSQEQKLPAVNFMYIYTAGSIGICQCPFGSPACSHPAHPHRPLDASPPHTRIFLSKFRGRSATAHGSRRARRETASRRAGGRRLPCTCQARVAARVKGGGGLLPKWLAQQAQRSAAQRKGRAIRRAAPFAGPRGCWCVPAAPPRAEPLGGGAWCNPLSYAATRGRAEI